MANLMPVAYGAVAVFAIVGAIKGPAKAPNPVTGPTARIEQTAASAAHCRGDVSV